MQASRGFKANPLDHYLRRCYTGEGARYCCHAHDSPRREEMHLKLLHALRTGVALVALAAYTFAGTQIDTNIALHTQGKNDGAAQGTGNGHVLDVQLPYVAPSAQIKKSNLKWENDGKYYNTSGPLYWIEFEESEPGSGSGAWADSDGHRGTWD